MHRKLRTDHRLWLTLSVIAFVLLGFVHIHTPAVEHKVGPSYFWGAVAFWPSVMEWWEVLFALGVFATLLAAPAAAFGWVAQAVIVVIRATGWHNLQKLTPSS